MSGCDNGQERDKDLASMAVGGSAVPLVGAVKPLLALVNKRNIEAQGKLKDGALVQLKVKRRILGHCRDYCTAPATATAARLQRQRHGYSDSDSDTTGKLSVGQWLTRCGTRVSMRA
ncbi:hypothetical protein VC83_05880 [Pseudogymnoascus destructans]|uniref:Uncharacterized protein n=1 Tax=Pseudogymnoascus destructans TaxID=655981 RepID=A0A177A518_9PEZI|nr:uncharacterized protein VC83_05880 [Pseudogymnoascus destructans]OAF57217.1 hypothetical protein VC83_05880 [Pseudogymnoascus destructans]